MKRIHAMVACLAALLVVSAGGVAEAAPRDTEAAVEEAARARVAEGTKLYAKKKYDRAMAAFLQAYAVSHNPSVLLSLGMTALRLDDPLRAVKFFEKFLHDAADAPADQRERARSGVVEARRSLGAIEVIAPDGAEISVDGAVVGRAPLATTVDALPGRHTVSSVSDGATRSETVDVAAKGVARARLGTPRVATAAPAEKAEPAPASAPVSAAGTSPPARTREDVGLFSPPASPGPAYLAGAVGIVGLSAAIILRGIAVNADRNVSVGQEALARSDKTRSSCRSTDGDAGLAATCASIADAEGTSSSVAAPFVATLTVGAGATLFALGWWMFARKAGEPPADVSASVGPRGEVDAHVRVRF